jgi:hypothetical protein
MRPVRPPDRPTRGKTAPNRLRRVDHLIAGWDPGLLRRTDGPFASAPVVDLGYGATPVTTLELARRLRRIAPGLPVAGVENDRERVRVAAAAGGDGIRFVHGGFELGSAAPARLIRAFNVLRQYDEVDVAPAYRAMAGAVLPGGLIVEGTSDPTGRVWTAFVVRRADAADAANAPGLPPAVELEAIVFGTNFRGGLDAASFQAVLPKRLIHRMVDGEAAHEFMRAWAVRRRDAAASDTWGPRYAFGQLALALRAAGHEIDRPEANARRGWIVWRRPPVELLGETG